jgi:hypothetical protein
MSTKIDLTAKAIINGKEIEVVVDMPISEDDIKEAIEEEYKKENEPEEDEFEIEPFDFTIIDWGEAEGFFNLQDLKTIFEINESNINYDIDVISAAVECGIKISNIEEAYNGKFNDDEDFAEETANSLGYINKDTHWPYTCIDWKQAARELMYDYNEADGYYFRIL